jgi:hypothetical protein
MAAKLATRVSAERRSTASALPLEAGADSAAAWLFCLLRFSILSFLSAFLCSTDDVPNARCAGEE